MFKSIIEFGLQQHNHTKVVVSHVAISLHDDNFFKRDNCIIEIIQVVLDHTLDEMSFNILGIFLLEEVDIILGFIIILDVDTTNSDIELTLFD